MGGYAAKQRDLGLCQAATAAIILSIPRMLSARRKLACAAERDGKPT